MHVVYVAHALLLVLILGTANSVDAAVVQTRRSSSSCQPFESSFAASDLSRYDDTSFRVVSPPGSVSSSSHGLEVYLEKPRGASIHEGWRERRRCRGRDGQLHVHDAVSPDSARKVDSRLILLLRYGKVTFEITAPTVPGVVTAAVMICTSCVVL